MATPGGTNRKKKNYDKLGERRGALGEVPLERCPGKYWVRGEVPLQVLNLCNRL